MIPLQHTGSTPWSTRDVPWDMQGLQGLFTRSLSSAKALGQSKVTFLCTYHTQLTLRQGFGRESRHLFGACIRSWKDQLLASSTHTRISFTHAQATALARTIKGENTHAWHWSTGSSGGLRVQVVPTLLQSLDNSAAGVQYMTIKC